MEKRKEKAENKNIIKRTRDDLNILQKKRRRNEGNSHQSRFLRRFGRFTALNAPQGQILMEIKNQNIIRWSGKMKINAHKDLKKITNSTGTLGMILRTAFN